MIYFEHVFFKDEFYMKIFDELEEDSYMDSMEFERELDYRERVRDVNAEIQ
jgi:hypothetical protein